MKVPTFQWMAIEKSSELPYVCTFGCDVGYTWLKKLKKCVKVVNELSEKRQHSDASVYCAEENSRLLSIASCTELESLTLDFQMQFQKVIHEYWIGTYLEGFQFNEESNRVSKANSRTINAKGYAGLDAAASNSVCSNNNKVHMVDENGDPFFTVTPSLDGYYGNWLLVQTGNAVLQYRKFEKEDNSPKMSFLCEKEKEWSCPDDYILFQSLCYKLIPQEVTFPQSEKICKKENAIVIEPKTRLHHVFISAWLSKKNLNSPVIWLGVRRHTYTLNSIADDEYHTSESNSSFSFQSNGLDFSETGSIAGNSDDDCVVMDSNAGKF